MKIINLIFLILFTNNVYANYMMDVQDFSNICNYTFKDNLKGLQKIEDKYTLNPLFLTEEIQCNSKNLIDTALKYKSFDILEHIIKKSRKEFLINKNVFDKVKKTKNEKLIKIVEKKIK